MFKKIIRKANYLSLKTENISSRESSLEIDSDNTQPIPTSIDKVKEKLQNIVSDSSDFVMREVTLGNETRTKILIAFIDGLVEKQLITDNLLRPIMVDSRITDLEQGMKVPSVITILKENLLSTDDLIEVTDFVQTVHDILAGDTILYIDGEEVALKASLRGWESR